MARRRESADMDRLEAWICGQVCRDRDEGELQHYRAAFAQEPTDHPAIDVEDPRSLD
jgi:hypothetical protein